MKKVYLIMGPPGAGKGTLSQMLHKLQKFTLIETGEIFRNHIKNNTAIGLEFTNYINQGQLAPDSVVNNMMKEHFDKHLSNPSTILVDGYPRSWEQAEYMHDYFDKHNLKVVGVIWLEADLTDIKNRIVNRLLCEQCNKTYNIKSSPSQQQGKCDLDQGRLIKRADDSASKALTRYHIYQNETKPLYNFYNNKNLIISCKTSDKTPEQVYNHIMEIIGE